MSSESGNHSNTAETENATEPKSRLIVTPHGVPGADQSVPRQADTVAARIAKPTLEIAPETLSSVLGAVGQAAYEWSLEDDVIRWSGGAEVVLGVSDRNAIGTGRGYAKFLDTDNMTSPYDTVVNGRATDRGNGVAFQIDYKFRPQGNGHDIACWLEDTGRWFAGTDGSPARVCGVVRRVDQRHERDQELHFLSNCDPLTGNMNRARLADAIDQAIVTSERQRMPCAFLLAAIDNLALINDAYGFDIADEVIAKVAERIRAQLRSGDSIGRYAGNKFGILISNCSDQDMQVAANRLLRCVRDSVLTTSAGPVAATISLGGVALPRHARDAGEAMVRAEETLGQAKSRYNDSFVAYQHSGKRESIRKRNILYADEIVSALNERRLAIAYQPIVNANSGRVDFYECLLRVVKSDDVVMSAGPLIPVAEQIGLIRLIDHRVLELAIETLEESEDVMLSLNVSGKTANDPVWLSNLTAFITSHRSVAERLIIETTETVAIHDIEETQKFVKAVRDLGCKVAIDDFGAGYTSFSNLKMLDVDIVKIDGSFIQRLADNPDDQVFVRTLVDLAKNFGTKVVAEWVEDDTSAAMLRDWGINYLQGHLFGAAELRKPWIEDTNHGNNALAMF